MWRTIRHLVWHDARALHVTLAVWAGVLALQAGTVAVGPQFLGSGDYRADLKLSLGALVMRLAMTVILTALIIQRDTAVGTTAFWLTRPIPPVTMWAAKLASIAGWLILLPSALAWALFVGLGLSAASAWDAASQLFFEQTLAVAFSLMAASVTATLAHFVVAGLAGFTTLWFLTLSARAWRDSLAMITLPGPDSIFFTWVGSVVIGAVVVSAHQYLTRRWIRTWVLAVLCLVIAQGTLVFVRNTPNLDPAAWSSRTYDPPADVEVRLGDNVEHAPVTLRGPSGQPAPGWALSTSVWATSSSDTDVLEPVGVRWSIATSMAEPATTIRWTESVRRGTWWANAPSTPADQPIRSIRTALGVDTLAFASSSLQATPLFRAYVAEWPVEAYRTFVAKGGGTLRAEVVVRAYRYRVGGAMPLRAGAAYAAGDRRLRITDVERTLRGIVVTVRTAFVSPFDTNVGRQGGVHYVLRNRARREALFFTDQQTSNRFLTLGTTPIGPGTGLRRFEFDSQRLSNGSIALTNDWIEGAELVVLVPEALGMFTKSAEVSILTTGAVR